MTKRTRLNNLIRQHSLAGMCVMVLLFVGTAFAFQTKQVQSVVAEVTTGGTVVPPNNNFQINHLPLQGISPVTRLAIIQGVAGTNVINANFASFRALRAPGGSSVRVYVEFKLIPQGQPIDPDTIEPTRLPDVVGSDPLPFEFQIQPSSITFGALLYRIYAEKLNGAGEVIASVAFPETRFQEVGVIAQASRLIDPNGDRIILFDGNPNDGQTVIDIPAGALSQPTALTIAEIDLSNQVNYPTSPGFTSPVAMYQIISEPGLNAPIRLSLLYPDYVFGEGINGQDGILDGTEYPETLASLAWWDGFEWRNLGGTINTQSNFITSRIRSASYVGVFPLGAPSPKQRRPMEKIITPNGDDLNDYANFTLTTGTVEIFDMTGHRIRLINASTETRWDGRDDSGRIVEGGVYLYQFEVDGELVSGLIAVAK